jgi:hypothetical protein
MVYSKLNFLLALALIFNSSSYAAEEWNFVWVTSSPTGFQTQSGKAVVSLNPPKISAELTNSIGLKYSLSGTVKGESFTGKFTVLNSDYFQNSPLAGTFVTKHWAGVAGSSGREVISASDGFNFLGLTRELP